MPAEVRESFCAKGIAPPWSHQAEAAELAVSGLDVVLATGTASGKSLAYQLPALAALTADQRASVLYLAPTKALAADQLQSLEALGLPALRAAAYDGDTADGRPRLGAVARELGADQPGHAAPRHAAGHARWARVLRRLRYVVVDECHAYRGVFGSHVALVLRRLTRLARMYGSDPVFVLASATSAEPERSAGRLIGRPVLAVTDDGRPGPGADFVLWEPAIVPGSQGQAAHRCAGRHLPRRPG